MKSVQAVSKQKRLSGYAKTDVRYWHEAVFQPTYTRDESRHTILEWSAKIQHQGRRETFAMNTPNRSAAANRAKEIYLSLLGVGWAATLAKFKPKAADTALRHDRW